MAAASTAASMLERVRGSLLGLACADALSMPVHWYYNPRDILTDYGGWLTDFAAPKERHPSSIMSLSATGTGGRGSQSGDIIGGVINHGKKHLWGVKNVHYHHGMTAGENTLNAVVARVLLRSIAESGSYSPAAFLSSYVKFMTTPGSHNDTYAETYHRMFFANWARGVKPERCAEDDGHNVASAGGLVLIPPAALWAAASSALSSGGDLPAAIAAAQEAAVAQMYTTHKSEELERFVRVYAELLARVLLGEPLRPAVARAGKAIGIDIPGIVAKSPPAVAASAGAGGVHPDTAVIGRVFSSACYIEHSFPSLLYLAYKYADDVEAALVANTNVGGENCHRGAALGALVGLAAGPAGIPERWQRGLAAGPAITAEIEAFVATLQKGASAGAPAA